MSALLLAGAVLFVRHAVARVGEHGTSLLGDLAGFGDFAGRTTGYTLNGQEFLVGSAFVREPLDTALQQVVAVCQSGDGELLSDLAAHSEGQAQGLREDLFVLRSTPTEGTAFALCFSGFGEGGVAGVVERLGRFASSLDFAELGRFRMVRLRQVEGGTQLVAAAAEGSVRLQELVPPAGQDVVGAELVDGVRPAAATRFLDARPAASEHHITAYRSALSARDVYDDTRRQLEQAGYATPRLGQLPAAVEGTAGTLSAVFQRGEHTVLLTSVGDGEGSLIAMTQLSRDAAEAVQEDL